MVLQLQLYEEYYVMCVHELCYCIARQALLSLLVNDQLVINCNDSGHSCLMLIIV